jgi:hypothetical protein
MEPGTEFPGLLNKHTFRRILIVGCNSNDASVRRSCQCLLRKFHQVVMRCTVHRGGYTNCKIAHVTILFQRLLYHVDLYTRRGMRNMYIRAITDKYNRPLYHNY